jgi:hypothetical protein
MPTIQLRGRVINKTTRQPISGVTLNLLKRAGGGSSGSTSSTPVTVDTDGEFDHGVLVSTSADKFELTIDKDAGYKFKAVSVTFNNISAISKDIGEIELEPYTD